MEHRKLKETIAQFERDIGNIIVQFIKDTGGAYPKRINVSLDSGSNFNTIECSIEELKATGVSESDRVSRNHQDESIDRKMEVKPNSSHD